METQAAIDRFLASPALSDSTRRAYGVDVAEFGAWLRARKASVDDVDARLLADYAAEDSGGAPRPRAEQARAGNDRAEARSRPRLSPLHTGRLEGSRRPACAAAAAAASGGAEAGGDRGRARAVRFRRPARDQEPRARRARLLSGAPQPGGGRPRPRRRGVRPGGAPCPRQGRQGARRAARRGGRVLGRPLASRATEARARRARRAVHLGPRSAAGHEHSPEALSPTRIACVTPSRRTCWRAAPTSGRSRSSSATPRCRRPRCTATSTRSASGRSMTAPTRDPELEGFLALSTARLAPRTVEAYRRDLEALARWLGHSPSTVTTEGSSATSPSSARRASPERRSPAASRRSARSSATSS